VTAYVYDWNALPIGQLWLNELETYSEFQPTRVLSHGGRAD
jgi:hypothetical protein